MHVHLLYPPSSDDLDTLKTLLHDEIIITTGEIQPSHYSAEVLVAGRLTDEELHLFQNLDLLVVPWTGIPPETLEAVRIFPNLKLHNLHHNAVPVAEMALTLLFAAAKRVIPFDQELREGDWKLRYEEPDVPLLAGKRALIIGYGDIGRRIEFMLEQMDIRIKAIRRTTDYSGENIHSQEDLFELLPETDILILALPHTPESDGLIGKRELDLLADRAILVNISRGKVVDQGALYQALKERKLFAAGLDVWYNYPPDKESRSNTMPGDFPFQDLDNLVLSPHRAGLVRETETLRMHALADLLNAAAGGKIIPNEVNIDLGY